MIKRMCAFALPLALMLMLIGSAAPTAQAWNAFEFKSSGRYEYHVQTFEYFYWDDASELKSEYYYTITVRKTNDESPEGEPILDVTTASRRPLTDSELRDMLNFGVFAFEDSFMFGGPFEFSIVLNALPDMEFEVGERMSMFGMGRISIVKEETIAGRKGLLVRYEMGDASDRWTSLEWVIDDKLPLPLAVRQYDEQGRLTLNTTLVKYEAL